MSKAPAYHRITRFSPIIMKIKVDISQIWALRENDLLQYNISYSLTLTRLRAFRLQYASLDSALLLTLARTLCYDGSPARFAWHSRSGAPLWALAHNLYAKEEQKIAEI